MSDRERELEQQNAALRTELARFANEDHWERCFAECRDEHVWAYIGPDHTMPVQETPSSIATAALSVPSGPAVEQGVEDVHLCECGIAQSARTEEEGATNRCWDCQQPISRRRASVEQQGTRVGTEELPKAGDCSFAPRGSAPHVCLYCDMPVNWHKGFIPGSRIPWSDTRTLRDPATTEKHPDSELSAITALLDALETCHICKGILALDGESPMHCENCSWDCDEHDEPECAPLHVLHRAARKAVAAMQSTPAVRERDEVRHVCGLQGFGRGIDGLNDVCPACHEMHEQWDAKRVAHTEQEGR